MAEDRMLSDEILLGLINKNSGGGGGTTNYNDLSNQPQIGGVTLIGNMTASDLGLATETALADKADKSAVKNEFIGTLAQWNALTAEQRKAYDTYQIKGDYTEGGGSLPDYSTTEQALGIKWIDGKDIYRKVVDFGALPNLTTKTVSSGLTNVNITRIYGIACASVAIIPLPYSNEVTLYFSNNNVCVATNDDFSNYEQSYVVIEYTKNA